MLSYSLISNIILTFYVSYKPFLIECSKRLLNSNYQSVKYEAAKTLLFLAPKYPYLVGPAVACYVDLLRKETDNSAKLSILSNIESILHIDPTVLGDSLMRIFDTEEM